jgi:hypothetical protein
LQPPLGVLAIGVKIRREAFFLDRRDLAFFANKVKAAPSWREPDGAFPQYAMLSHSCECTPSESSHCGSYHIEKAALFQLFLRSKIKVLSTCFMKA